MWHRGPWSASSGRSSRAARRPGSPTANSSSGSRPPATRPPSPPWWRGTGRWCWASAASSWATTSTPRTPSRPSSSCWPARPDRCASRSCWATGSTAWRCARHAGPAARLDRRRQIEEEGAVRRPEARPAVQAEQMIDREQAEALHREIDRLPGTFRRAVVLCYFEGLSPDEAAARLRWPSGTLRSRLVRAREKLRRGLVAPRCGALDDRDGRGAGAPIRLGVRLIPPVRFHHPGRDRLRGPSRRRRQGAAPPRPWPRRSCDPC